MSNTIWKFELPVPQDPLSMISEVSMPLGARILTIDVQMGRPQIWAVVDPAAQVGVRRFQVVPTGAKFDAKPSAHYLGTFQLAEGLLVFHVFEVL